MREPRIYLSASCSLVVHFLLVLLAALMVNPAVKVDTQRNYLVSIVSDLSQPISSPEGAAKTEMPAQERAVDVPAPKPLPKDNVAKKESTAPKDRQLANKAVQDRISELRAKKRIEKIVTMRSSIDISSAAKTQGNASTQGAASKAVQGKGDYLSMVRAKIMERWIYPESIDRELEAVISIRIRKDGTVQLIGLEKSSGNRLFDRSALSAISSIALLPSPPEGVEEIGIRFKP